MNFRTLDLSIELYEQCKRTKLPYYLKDQLLRASSSVCLNLAEGNCRMTNADRKRFFNIAISSLREVQIIIKMEQLKSLESRANHVGACLYKLIKSLD